MQISLLTNFLYRRILWYGSKTKATNICNNDVKTGFMNKK
jgi:hypothetical protein